jgi:hypothetical protein
VFLSSVEVVATVVVAATTITAAAVSVAEYFIIIDRRYCRFLDTCFYGMRIKSKVVVRYDTIVVAVVVVVVLGFVAWLVGWLLSCYSYYWF